VVLNNYYVPITFHGVIFIDDIDKIVVEVVVYKTMTVRFRDTIHVHSSGEDECACITATFAVGLAFTEIPAGVVDYLVVSSFS